MDLLFLVKPNFAPILFQLCPDIALCKVLGDVLRVKSEVGGVVGGVIGSIPKVEFGLPLSSVKSISAVSIELEVERLPAPPRPMINSGRYDALGDWLASSAGVKSLVNRRCVRPSL